MKKFIEFVFLLTVLFCDRSFSQNSVIHEKTLNDFSVSVSGNYISSASLQLYSGTGNLVEENLLTELEGGYSIGLNLKKRIFGDNIFLTLSSEYISLQDDELYQVLYTDSNLFKINVSEKLTVIPLELSFYYLLPEFFKNTNIYIGGGIGTYFGNRKRQLGPYFSETLSTSLNFSMNVLFCAEYKLSENFAANIELRFRDAQYGVFSRYPYDSITIDGVVYHFPQEFKSDIFIDGLRIGFGFTYFVF